MTYKLKPGQTGFEIVDGPLAGRRFLPGEVYPEVPPGDEDRFERAEKAPVVQMPKRAKSGRIEDESA
jgi:hypothetical protein